MIKNIFITGKPGCGKTSLIIEIIRELNLRAGGFYTQEIRTGRFAPCNCSAIKREKRERKGFSITSLNGRKGILAHKDFQNSYKVGKYGVNLKDLEEVGVNSILDAVRENKIVIIDEIGKMEMFSDKFKKVVEIALDSKNKVLGIIKLTQDVFTNKVKNRPDTKIFNLTKKNRKEIKGEITKLLGPN